MLLPQPPGQFFADTFESSERLIQCAINRGGGGGGGQQNNLPPSIDHFWLRHWVHTGARMTVLLNNMQYRQRAIY